MKKTTETRLKDAMKNGRQLQLWLSLNGSFHAGWAGDPTREASGQSVDDAVSRLLEKD